MDLPADESGDEFDVDQAGVGETGWQLPACFFINPEKRIESEPGLPIVFALWGGSQKRQALKGGL